jgi:hypothetical protein
LTLDFCPAFFTLEPLFDIVRRWKVFFCKSGELSPAQAGLASWQVSGGIAGGSFIAPWVGNTGERLLKGRLFRLAAASEA